MHIPKCMVKRPLGFGCLATVLLLFLAVRANQDLGLRTEYEKYEGQRVTVTGRIYKKETARRAAETVIYLKVMEKFAGEAGEADMGPPGERVICYLSAGQIQPELGSTVKLSGKFKTFERASNPGQFDAYSYYQISGISYRLNQAAILAKTAEYNRFLELLYSFREFLSDKLSEGLPEKEASIMQTMLLGEKGGMEKELKALYQRNGIAHILAISGLHISLLGMGIYHIFRKCAVPMKAAAVLSCILMFLYGAMTGFSVSAVRAIAMFCVQMLGVLLERTYDMVTAAAVAAALILIKQPLYLLHSGFWFSFGCVLGIALLLPVLTKGKRQLHPLAKGFLGGVGMTAVTLPLYLWFYYQFPVYSVFLNFLVIPLMSLLMAAGLLFLTCQIVFSPAAIPFSFFIKGVLLVYEEACKICECLPGHLFTSGRPKVWQMAVYLLLLIFPIIMKKKAGLTARWMVILAGVIILIVRPAGGLKLIFLDVGQGDCIYIENENKSRYLVDGGSSSVSSVGEYRILPFFKYQGACRLDAVFVTHPDEDHCNGIKELLSEGKRQGIEIGALILPDISEEVRKEGYLELVEAAGEGGIPVFYIGRGRTIKSGELLLECLHPMAGSAVEDANEYSTVLGLNYRGFRAMLTGDVENDGERQLIRHLQENTDFREVTVLKAAHHGSKNSTGEDFLHTVYPRLAVVSAGKNNKYGHPHPELLNRLREKECVVYETSKSGAVTVNVKGRQVRVSTFLS